MEPTFSVEPFSQRIGEHEVSAVIDLDRSNDRWDVTVVLSKDPDQPPIEGGEVEARLIDDRGEHAAVLRRPSGPLVEAGGSLSASANAPFSFEHSGGVPDQLLATYQGQTVRFRIIPT